MCQGNFGTLVLVCMALLVCFEGGRTMSLMHAQPLVQINIYVLVCSHQRVVMERETVSPGRALPFAWHELLSSQGKGFALSSCLCKSVELKMQVKLLCSGKGVSIGAEHLSCGRSHLLYVTSSVKDPDLQGWDLRESPTVRVGCSRRIVD